MLEREQYNIEMDKQRREQISELSKYLDYYIKLNAEIRSQPVSAEPDPKLIHKYSTMPIPEKGREPKAVGNELAEEVLSHSMNLQHPRFFSFVASAVSPYSVAGSVLTDIFNPNACGFSISPVCGVIEENLIRWMGSLAGFDPKACGGIFTSGGSLSNLTGMIAAREKKLPGRFDLANAVAFCSDQAHSSVKKGMRLMGLRNDQIIILETDDDYKMRVDLLEAAIKKELDAGRKPFLLVGSMGTTNTGSIDPLDSLADIAEKYELWFHVDGAYGGSVLLSPIYKHLLAGLERADSFSWDLHKWALQDYSCSCVIVRDKHDLLNAFSEHPEYLADILNEEHNDGWDLGIEMSRPARAIKFWYTLQCMGTDLMADLVDYAFFNAKTAEKSFREMDDWEIVSKPMCGAINVRYVPKSVPAERYNDLNAAISEAVLKDGYAYIVTTVLKGKRVLRLCFINGNTETSDVLNTVERMGHLARSLEKEFRG